MDSADLAIARQIGDRARHAQHAGIAPRGQTHRVRRFQQEPATRFIRGGVLVERIALQFRVGANAAGGLSGASGRNPAGDFIDDEVRVTDDLYEVLQAFRTCRPSA